MRNWTEKDAATIRDLEAKKNRAYSALDESLSKLGKGTFDSVGMETVRKFLRTHGQEVLDVLIDHFEPSPRTVNVSDYVKLGELPQGCTD